MLKILALTVTLILCSFSAYTSEYEQSDYGFESEYIWPTKGTITQEFDASDHEGIDIAKRKGTPIVAVKDGKVVKAKYSRVYGNYIMIRHEGGVVTLYGHHSKLLVRKGDVVLQGDIIGEMGSTGYSTGNHLHFEIQVNGRPRDPRSYLPSAGGSL